MHLILKLQISKYEKFVNDMWSFVGDIIPNVENNSDLTHKLGHLCECVKQALADVSYSIDETHTLIIFIFTFLYC